jgi:hypothetical protein
MPGVKFSISWLLLTVASVAVSASAAAEPINSHNAPRYRVLRTSEKVVIDGRLDEKDWKNTKGVGKFRFPWWAKGEQEQTEAKLMWDDRFLYVSYRCDDAHIWAEHTKRDSPVYRDDCVEVFIAPNPNRPNDYFNIEMNVKGAFLDQHHPEGPGVKVKKEWNAKSIQIAVTIDGTLNDDRDTDRGWILEAAIPFANFSKVAKYTPPKSGDVWHLNLNRLGGKTNPQFSQWSPSKTETPQFHAPKGFGRVIFSTANPGK